MPENPKVSVIIPTYNRQSVLTEAIESVLKQSEPALELIIVDDGSTDETAEFVRKYPVKYVYQENAGPSKARNVGVSHAKGNWLAFLDSDDRWMENKLEQQLNAIREFPDIQIFYTGERWIRNGKRVNQCKHHQKHSGWIYEECIPLCIISPSSILLKKQLFEEAGGFDEDLPAAEDYDLWLRLSYKYQIQYIDEELIIKTGGHEDQLSKMWGIDRYRVTALEKMLVKPELKPEWRKLTHEDLLRRIKILIKGFQKHNNEEQLAIYQDKLNQWKSAIL